MVSVLYVEKAEVEGNEELKFVGAVSHPASCGTAGGETLELSGSALKDGHRRSPCGVEARDGIGHCLVDEFLSDEMFCYHAGFLCCKYSNRQL